METLSCFLTAFLVALSCLSEAAPRHRHVTADEKNDHAQDWLVKYGYLHNSEDVTFFERTMALMNMQKFHGLPVTGVVSDEVYNIMQMPRCGFPDMIGDGDVWGQNSTSSKSARIRRYSINQQRKRWDTNSITYRFVDYTTDLTSTVQEQELAKVAAKWSAVSKLSISRGSGASASIDISFHRGNHGDSFPFDGPNGVLGHAYFPGGGLGGDIHFDDDEAFTTTAVGADFTYISLHEMGHSLGLEHSSNPLAVMSTTFVYSADDVQLHDDDIAGLQSLYGAPDGGTVYEAPEVTAPGQIICDKIYDAICDVAGTYFFFSGSTLTQANSNFLPINQPVSLNRLTTSGPNSVDAAYVSDNEWLTLFKGDSYWRVNIRSWEQDDGTPSLISDFGVPIQSVGRVDAVLYRPGTVYLFRGTLYWRYDTTTRATIGPFTIQGTWPRVTVTDSSPLTSVFYRQSGDLIYFVSGTTYWAYTSQSVYQRTGNLNEEAAELCRWCQAIDPDSGAMLLPKFAAILSCLILTTMINHF